MDDNRKYQFSWDLLGDINEGRPNLGNLTRVEIYRLMQFTLRDVIERNFGTEVADQIFYDSGKLAGKAFYEHYLNPQKNLNDFMNQLESLFKELGIGILRIEHIDMDKGELTLTVSEDLDCSGLPENGFEVCTYDEGFISALLESFTGIAFEVREIDCWCTGDRTCRFLAKTLELSQEKL
ncbi:V4R domain-containing protein [Fusibacter ferrireducens]|uniref:4-vinyl reductase n=1 Tax=Fusibacter ferrireducens TaxID=2785058 RepID=A0ABR9ZV57_9FIRM|nr:V4R domain-containing protein [Fusibacter ferrireducens]MBF4694236.1 4-vinyl reductase [Fusibacter ferrireducens]